MNYIEKLNKILKEHSGLGWTRPDDIISNIGTEWSSQIECPECNGEGSIEEYCGSCDGSGDMYDGSRCQHCKGMGGGLSRCGRCDGEGVIDAEEDLE